ncbi:hypothetical protein ACMA5I_05345 [Paracoccaceae bacterium GXU_MW_L88]
MMVWISAPDGRTARHAVDVVKEGPGLRGPFYTSDVVLEQFQNGARMVVDSPMTRRMFIDTDMRGTGAARLAFLEQCGI